MPRRISHDRTSELIFADAAAKARFMDKLAEYKQLLKKRGLAKRLKVPRASDIANAAALDYAMDEAIEAEENAAQQALHIDITTTLADIESPDMPHW